MRDSSLCIDPAWSTIPDCGLSDQHASREESVDHGWSCAWENGDRTPTMSEIQRNQKQTWIRRKCWLWLRFTLSAWPLFAAPVQAAIPQRERNALIALFDSTGGDNWDVSTGWKGPVGTECAWYGITCDETQSHVKSIILQFNNLTGSLPSIRDLSALERFDVSFNDISGSVPSLQGITSPLLFRASYNHLTGSIPSLTGLTNLSGFVVDGNHLTGTIPTLAGLTNLDHFIVSQNRLIGSIPSLTNLPKLQQFDVGENRLSGPLPSLAGLPSLISFIAAGNRLSGSIQPFVESSNLGYFDVMENDLTGSVPSLANLSNLTCFFVSYNQLSGDMPSVPRPDGLEAGCSELCPNSLNPIPDPAWDAATWDYPWYRNCTPLPDSIFANGYEMR